MSEVAERLDTDIIEIPDDSMVPHRIDIDSDEDTMIGSDQGETVPTLVASLRKKIKLSMKKEDEDTMSEVDRKFNKLVRTFPVSSVAPNATPVRDERKVVIKNNGTAVQRSMMMSHAPNGMIETKKTFSFDKPVEGQPPQMHLLGSIPLAPCQQKAIRKWKRANNYVDPIKQWNNANFPPQKKIM